MERRWYIVCASHDKLFLDVATNSSPMISNGNKAIVSDFHRGVHREWEINDSDHSILSAGTSMAIDIGSRGGVKQGNDIILWQLKTNNRANQVWVYDPDTRTLLCPRYNLVLEVRGFSSGSTLFAAVPGPSPKPEQQWRIFSTDVSPVNYQPYRRAPVVQPPGPRPPPQAAPGAPPGWDGYPPGAPFPPQAGGGYPPRFAFGVGLPAGGPPPPPADGPPPYPVDFAFEPMGRMPRPAPPPGYAASSGGQAEFPSHEYREPPRPNNQ
jgi:hypothetical protein